MSVQILIKSTRFRLLSKWNDDISNADIWCTTAATASDWVFRVINDYHPFCIQEIFMHWPAVLSPDKSGQQYSITQIL